jgi:hypothetical protein
MNQIISKNDSYFQSAQRITCKIKENNCKSDPIFERWFSDIISEEKRKEEEKREGEKKRKGEEKEKREGEEEKIQKIYESTASGTEITKNFKNYFTENNLKLMIESYFDVDGSNITFINQNLYFMKNSNNKVYFKIIDNDGEEFYIFIERGEMKECDKDGKEIEEEKYNYDDDE